MNDRIKAIAERCDRATDGLWRWENDLLLTSSAAHLVLKPYYDDDTGEVSTCVMPYDADLMDYPHSQKIIKGQANQNSLLRRQIDRLQAELSQKTQQLEAYKRTGLTPDEFKQSVDYVLELNKKCKESTGCTAEEIANIKDQLSTYKAAMQNWHEEDI